MRRTTITLATLVTAIASSSPAVAATSGARPPLPSCPSMWQRAAPPLNPALGCVPTFVKSAVSRSASKACPPGWSPARRPLNPRLGCLPSFVVAYARARQRPAGGCPALWTKAPPHLTAALRCVPGFESSAFGDGDRSVPPAACPPQWRPATAPLNPVLKCVPGFLASVQGGPPAAGYCWTGWVHVGDDGTCVPKLVALMAQVQSGPLGDCPSGWRRAVPPLNPSLRCVPDFIVSALVAV